MGWFGKKSQAPQATTVTPNNQAQAAQPNVTQRDPETEKLDMELAHQREMARLQAQQDKDRQERQTQRRQERRETRQHWMQAASKWWHGQPKPEQTPLERHRARIESFEEDRETLPEKGIRYLFLALAYVLPFVVALAIGKEIGDAYSGTTDFWADGWSIGTHTVAYAGEFSLAMMVLSTAAAFRRYKADSSYTPKLLSSLFFFFLFIAASSLAQWFIAEQHIHPKNNADLAALIFRVTMPPAVDVASMLYLSIMGYKSLKKFLDEQQQKANAIKLLNEAELTIQAAQQEAERRQKEAEQYLAQKERRESLLLRIEEIHSQAMVEMAQRALLGKPGPVHVAEAQPLENKESAPEQIPMPGVRRAVPLTAGQKNHGAGAGTYERWSPESESADDGSSFRS